MVTPKLASKIRLIGVFAAVLALALTALSSVARSQMIRSDQETTRILAIEKFAAEDGLVTGEVRSKSSHAVSKVHSWLSG